MLSMLQGMAKYISSTSVIFLTCHTHINVSHLRFVQEIHEGPKYNLCINGCAVLIGCCSPISSHLTEFRAHLSYAIFYSRLETIGEREKKKREWKNSGREDKTVNYSKEPTLAGRLDWMISKDSFQLLLFCDLPFCIRFFNKSLFSTVKMNIFPNTTYFRCYSLKTPPPVHCVINATIVLIYFSCFSSVIMLLMPLW